MPYFSHNSMPTQMSDGTLVVWHVGLGVPRAPYISGCTGGVTRAPGRPVAEPASAAPYAAQLVPTAVHAGHQQGELDLADDKRDDGAAPERRVLHRKPRVS